MSAKPASVWPSRTARMMPGENEGTVVDGGSESGGASPTTHTHTHTSPCSLLSQDQRLRGVAGVKKRNDGEQEWRREREGKQKKRKWPRGG